MNGWLKNAVVQANKPKFTIIGELKKRLGGYQVGRPRDVLHASDITKPSFCPREEALMDIGGDKPKGYYVQTALQLTFDMGAETERLFVEEWTDGICYGNWKCRFCNEQRTMCFKPSGFCGIGKITRRHWWEYLQVRVESKKYDVSGGIDALLNLGAPRLFVTEVKTMAANEFDKIAAPLPEHRLRTNLYMRLVDESDWEYKDKINVEEARVLYISRGFGRANPEWDNEILPFREYPVKRDDSGLKDMLQKASALKIFRHDKKMPQGICATANDPVAKNSCSKVKECFSGLYPPEIAIKECAG